MRLSREMKVALIAYVMLAFAALGLVTYAAVLPV